MTHEMTQQPTPLRWELPAASEKSRNSNWLDWLVWLHPETLEQKGWASAQRRNPAAGWKLQDTRFLFPNLNLEQWDSDAAFQIRLTSDAALILGGTDKPRHQPVVRF